MRPYIAFLLLAAGLLLLLTGANGNAGQLYETLFGNLPSIFGNTPEEFHKNKDGSAVSGAGGQTGPIPKNLKHSPIGKTPAAHRSGGVVYDAVPSQGTGAVNTMTGQGVA